MPGETFGIYAESETEDRVWNSGAGGPLFDHGGEGKFEMSCENRPESGTAV